MNTKFIMTMVLALVVQIMSAQTYNNRKSRLQAEMKLTQEQQAEIKQINAEGKAEVKIIMGNDQINKEEKKLLISNIRKANRQKRDNILTPEQLKIKAEKIELRKSMHMEHRKAMHTARIALDESLTELEKNEIQLIRNELRTDKSKQLKKRKMMSKNDEHRELREVKREEFRKEHAQEFSYLETLANKYAKEIDRLMMSARKESKNKKIQHHKSIKLEKPDATRMTNRRIKFLLLK